MKLLLLVLLAVGLAIAVHEPKARTGREGRLFGFVYINETEYYVDDATLLSWDQAIKYCKTLGMELISLTTQEKSDNVHNWFNTQGYGYWMWTSGRYLADSASFEWTANTNSSLDWGGSWAPGYPRNLNSPCNAISMYTRGWWDEDCDILNGIVCE